MFSCLDFMGINNVYLTNTDILGIQTIFLIFCFNTLIKHFVSSFADCPAFLFLPNFRLNAKIYCSFNISGLSLEFVSIKLNTLMYIFLLLLK